MIGGVFLETIHSYEDYLERVVLPMRKELTEIGFRELVTPEEVVEALEGEGKTGTTLVAVNSVCGCSGRIARPAVKLALQHERIPQHLYTVFAGQDREATEKAREYFLPYPPSSPSFALLREGKIVAMLERRQIETKRVEEVADDLRKLFDQFCS